MNPETEESQVYNTSQLTFMRLDVIRDNKEDSFTLRMRKTVNIYLSCVDQLISQTLCNGLDVPESSFSCSCAQQPDGLRQNKRERERGGETI